MIDFWDAYFILLSIGLVCNSTSYCIPTQRLRISLTAEVPPNSSYLRYLVHVEHKI
jgi:hypothetical protein